MTDRFQAPTELEERTLETLERCNRCGEVVRYVGEDFLAYCDDDGLVEGNTTEEVIAADEL